MCHIIFLLPVLALPVFWLFPISTAIPVYLSVLTVCLILYFLIFKAMRLKPLVGKEAMVGKTGVVIKDIAPEGKIQYGVEIWNAFPGSEGKKFSVGDHVVIQGFWGLNVLVKESPAQGE